MFNGMLLAPHLAAFFDGSWTSSAVSGTLHESPALSRESLLASGCISPQWTVAGASVRRWARISTKMATRVAR
jgi:hypothetical protein